jgi:16S rRNA (guanine966-N2)-methyltransferase
VRIVGGRLSGRRFKGPEGNVTRPTAERVREALASALEARGLIAGARVLDAYAGTGALGFEALSRGAAHVVFVERDPRVATALRRSGESLGLTAEITIVRDDLTRPRTQREVLSRGPFDLVLSDPPYADVERAVEALQALCRAGLLAPGGVLLLEHAAKVTPRLPDEFIELSSYRYGDTAVVLLSPESQEP